MSYLVVVFCVQYRREFADPFWNSQEQNMLTYLFMLMTSWAIVCDVYYLKPTTIQVLCVWCACVYVSCVCVHVSCVCTCVCVCTHVELV